MADFEQNVVLQTVCFEHREEGEQRAQDRRKEMQGKTATKTCHVSFWSRGIEITVCTEHCFEIHDFGCRILDAYMHIAYLQQGGG